MKCAKCMRTCASPLVFAIHHDQHYAPRAITCPHCELKYKSWAQYYRHDTCKRNSVPEGVKVAVEEAVNSVLSRSVGGVIGSELLADADNTTTSEEDVIADEDEDGEDDDGDRSGIGLMDSNSDGTSGNEAYNSGELQILV